MENIIVIEEKVILPETPLCEQTVTIPCIKGDKGDPLTYDDLTPEQIEQIQKPALDAAEVANDAAVEANSAAQSANDAADKANQAAESIAYKENGFYISHAFLEATDLRYIGFKEIKKTTRLVTCLRWAGA